ncbi:unnamed protein product [Didymodactylos carnosus]|uniref:Uncharacterized protein n=1 Tax=Didymodactylos carnosus TaxID=1234261 RepID=A0A814BM61_9BILA|nr:unnamed protein product [Didymodactylos carnosus]CAF1025151.1 unnamed protein product [Didymodactylos carnosus]CAF3706419.1 unnamed protein product [Didymodactylos carnosus]CAF3793632.1 unnamed protein product [Didymodactylos carnosus]
MHSVGNTETSPETIMDDLSLLSESWSTATIHTASPTTISLITDISLSEIIINSFPMISSTNMDDASSLPESWSTATIHTASTVAEENAIELTTERLDSLQSTISDDEQSVISSSYSIVDLSASSSTIPTMISLTTDISLSEITINSFPMISSTNMDDASVVSRHQSSQSWLTTTHHPASSITEEKSTGNVAATGSSTTPQTTVLTTTIISTTTLVTSDDLVYTDFRPLPSTLPNLTIPFLQDRLTIIVQNAFECFNNPSSACQTTKRKNRDTNDCNYEANVTNLEKSYKNIEEQPLGQLTARRLRSDVTSTQNTRLAQEPHRQQYLSSVSLPKSRFQSTLSDSSPRRTRISRTQTYQHASSVFDNNDEINY